MSESSKPKVLIVDDSEINRSLLIDMLGEQYEIIEARDGENIFIIGNGTADVLRFQIVLCYPDVLHRISPPSS